MNDGMSGVFNFSTTHGASANHKVMPLAKNGGQVARLPVLYKRGESHDARESL